MAERVLRARFEGDASGLKRMAQEGKQAIDSVVDAQEKASREMVAATEQAEKGMTAVAKTETQQRIITVQREANSTIREIEKLSTTRQVKEREIARVVEDSAKKSSRIIQQELRTQEQAHRQVSEVMGEQSAAAQHLARNILGLVAAYVSFQTVANMASAGIQGNASLEQAELTFATLFRDSERAKAKIEELYDFAATTPFEFGPVKDAALALETFGLNSSEYLRDAGDLAAAFGAEISEVARVFGRINSGDFGEAFERMRDFGISREMLEGEGLVFDKSGSYQGSVDQALTAVQNIIRARFGGMMAEQSQTAVGQWANASDTIQTLLNTAFSEPFEVGKQVLADFNKEMEDGELGLRLAEDAERFSEILGDAMEGGLIAAEAIGKVLLTAAEAMLTGFDLARTLGAQLGAETARRDTLRSGIADGGFGTATAALDRMAAQGMPLPQVLKTAPRLGVDQAGLGRIATIYAKAQQQAQAGLDAQLAEIVRDRGAQIDKIVADSKKTSTTTKKPAGGDTKAEEVLLSWVDEALHKSVDLLDLELGRFLQGLDGSGFSTTLSAMQRPAYSSGIPSSLGSLPSAVLGLGDPGPLREADLFGPGYGKAYDEFLKREATKLQKLAEDADKALQSGLEAGVSAFLDGGIGNLGEATYSLSKEAFKNALVDGIMESELKGAVGELGESFGAVLKGVLSGDGLLGSSGLLSSITGLSGAPMLLTAGAFGLAAKNAIAPDPSLGPGALINHVSKREEAAAELSSDIGSYRSMLEKRHKTRLNVFDSGDLGHWLQFGGDASFGGNVDQGAVNRDLAAFVRENPGKYLGGFSADDYASSNLTLNGALVDAENDIRKWAEAQGLAGEVTTELVNAKKSEIESTWAAQKAALEAAKSLEEVARSGDKVDKAVGVSELSMKIQGIGADDPRYAAGITSSFVQGLYDAGLDQDVAKRLVTDKKMQLDILGQYGYWAKDGFGEYGSAAWESGMTAVQNVMGTDMDAASLKVLFEQTLIPMFSRMADIAPATQSVGSLSNPDHALQFDAPQTRNIVNNNQFIVQAQAFMGNQAEAREFARMIGQEWREIEGQSV